MDILHGHQTRTKDQLATHLGISPSALDCLFDSIEKAGIALALTKPSNLPPLNIVLNGFEDDPLCLDSIAFDIHVRQMMEVYCYDS
jgi:hypothetical protein